MEKKQVIFSGVKPSGTPTLGNYLGAIKNWTALQHDYENIFCIVDIHAITVRQDPEILRQNSLNLLALYIACGLDPNKCVLFIQSHVHTHAELAWILNCYTMFGELSRMTQFKDKSKKHADNINVGLFSYPALMAADILLYSTNLVPVGEDQKQHLEIARDIAIRFNNIYGDVFVIPDVYMGKTAMRIKSLQNPLEKMGKSDDNSNGYISMLDTPDDIMKKFKRAVTDSASSVSYGEGRDGVNNLMSIYSAVTGKTMEEIETEFQGKGYGDFKTAVGDAVIEELRPIQKKYGDIISDSGYLRGIYNSGAVKASEISGKMLETVYDRIGFIRR